MVAWIFPVSGDILFQESGHGVTKFIESSVTSVVGNVSVHQPPQALDGVQMRTISRDEVEFDPPPRLGQPVADQFGVMVTGVVGTHGSTASPDTGPQYRLPYRAGTRSVPCHRQEKEQPRLQRN